jgi:hypothetical protein
LIVRHISKPPFLFHNFRLPFDIEWQCDEALNALRVKLIRRTIKAKTHDDKIANAALSIFFRFSSRKYRSKHGAFFSGCFKHGHPKFGNHILHALTIWADTV